MNAEQIITSGMLLQDYFAKHRLRGARCVVLGPSDSRRYVELAGGEIVPPDAWFDALVIGDESGFPFLETVDTALTTLFKLLDAGRNVHLVLPNPDLIYPSGVDSFGIAAGGVALLFEAALRRRYRDRPGLEFARLGKPYPHLYEAAMARCDTRDVVMIGDQLETDIAGAKACGIDSALITTGVSLDDIARCPKPCARTWRVEFSVAVNSAHRACAASTCATQQVSFFAYGTCRNSLGPCALDCGPSTPVIRNCACGKVLAQHGHERNGAALAHHRSRLAVVGLRGSFTAACSHGAVAGAFHPVAPWSGAERDFGAVRRIGFENALQLAHGVLAIHQRRDAQRQLQRRPRPQHVAGIFDRRQSIGADHGRNGRQVRLSTASPGSLTIGSRAAGERKLGPDGIAENLSRLLRLLRCAPPESRSRNLRGRMRPLLASSRRSSSCRAMRKEDGTTPLASPECTPSVSTSTLSVPAARPRSDVVIQS